MSFNPNINLTLSHIKNNSKTALPLLLPRPGTPLQHGNFQEYVSPGQNIKGFLLHQKDPPAFTRRVSPKYLWGGSNPKHLLNSKLKTPNQLKRYFLTLEFLIYFKSDLEDCYYPLLNSSFDNNLFDFDLNNPRGGFSLTNDFKYKPPFQDFSNFGFVARCQANVDHPFASYLFGIFHFF